MTKQVRNFRIAKKLKKSILILLSATFFLGEIQAFPVKAISLEYDCNLEDECEESVSHEEPFPSLNIPRNISPHKPDVYVAGLPTLSIDMNVDFDWDGSTESLQWFRDTWKSGATINVHNTNYIFELNNINVSVRGRGNSSWAGHDISSKRPIRFRFSGNQGKEMFDSGYSGRDWVLIANTIDPSHLRNFSTFYLGRLMGSMYFVPNAWFVHLYLDGEYRGVYMLADERESTEGRGNLKLDADPTVSEFMIELDGWLRLQEGRPVNTHWVDTNAGLFDIRYPRTSTWMNTPGNPHAMYAKKTINNVDAAIMIGEHTQIEAVIDIASFIDFYIVQELMANLDVGWASVFYQIRGLDQYRRLHAGPLWDFDVSAGNVLRPEAEHYNPREIGSIASRNYWLRNLINTPWFREKVRGRWLEIRDNEVVEMLNRIQYIALTFEEEFQRDLERWPDHGNHSWNSPTVRGLTTFMENAEFLHWWLSERAEWMTEFLNSPVTPREAVVVGGTGSGNYKTGDTVEITANAPDQGYEFSHWEAEPTAQVNFTNHRAPSTTFTMTTQEKTITAIFLPIGEEFIEYTTTFSGEIVASLLVLSVSAVALASKKKRSSW